MAETVEAAAYVVAQCEGNDCVRVAALDDLPGGRLTATGVVGDDGLHLCIKK
ncbi:MAG: hypothetical protein M3354_11370 [Chloroflexota bacterium]|nr:hypothetical protein [Chloroflexota bacterium]